MTISNNTISDCQGVASSDGSGSSAIAVWDDPSTQATITGNTMTNNSIGVAVVAYTGGTNDPKVVIGNGNLFDGGDYGVSFETWGPAYSPDVTFTGVSTFKGQLNSAIYINDGISAGSTIDISTAVFKTSGGSTITDNFAKEDLVVHAIDGTNRGLVRWNSTNLYVTSNSFVDPFTTPSIQRAMSVASDGDQVNVAAGTFVENGQVVINKNLSIVGADKATTIIKPAQNTGTDGDDRGWFLVSSDKTFNMSDVTLDGNGKLINIGILSHGHGTINNCILKNLGYNPSSDYAGRGVAFYNYNMTISNNTLSNIGRIGIYMNGTGITNATITGNTFTGKGPGDWLDYGIEVEGGANATITHNKVTDCKGIASVDNSGSAGFLATTYFAPGTQSTIEYNDFQNNSVDLAVGYDETDVTTVVAHNNSFTGSDFGVSTTAPPVNATCNWWGTANGNAIQTKTEGTVTYNGWLSSGGDSDSGPGFTPTGSCNGTPVAITLSSASNVSCPGTSTGAIDISVSGGSGSYAYTWSPTGASTQDLTGIAVGSYQVTVTDVTYGSTATLTQVIGTTNTLPGITTPSNQTLATAGGACTRTATWTPTVTGTPPPSVSYVFSGATTASASGDGSGSAFNKGVTYVTLTASNGCSPDATASFTITVNDTEKPSVSFANGTQNKDVALGTCAYPASSTEFDPTSVSDNCFGTTLGWALSGATTASGSTTLAGTSFHKGTTTVLWTVTDASSNTNTCTFNVVVTDPSNIYVNDASTTGDSFTYAAGNDGSGDGSKCSPYATVAHAVSVATSGSTIHVDAGTYDEQLVIDGKNLTIQGTGATTIIRPSAPSKLTAFHTYTTGVFPGWEGIVMAGVVVVKNTSSTTLKDFKVDGVNVTSLPTGSNRLAGVVFGESSGTIDNLTINTIKTTGYNDRTYGIDLSAVSGTHNIEVKNCSISDWARNGIQAMGASLTANIHNNVLVGPGTIGPANVPNGIVFIYQVGGNATSNDIRNSGYIGSQWKSAGIMVYGQVATGIILESNNIYNIDNAISLAMNSNDVIVRKNNLHNNEIGVHLEDGTTNNSITQNAINGNSIAGINLNNDGVPGTGNVAHYNNLSGNQTGTVNLDVTKTFDATSNYWGCPTTSGKVSYFSYYSSCSGDPGSFSFGPVVSNITAGATISSICSGSSTTIYASGGSDYVWSNSLGLGSSKVVSPTTSTTYSVTGKDSHGCAGAFASVSVTVSAAPTVTIENLVGGSGTVVLGNSRTLTAGGASSYLWNNGSTNNTITVSPTANTTYSVVGTTTGGCTGSTTYSITVASVSAGANRFICNGSNTVVAATVSGITATSYAWSAPGMTSQSFTASPQVTTTYTVTVNNDPSLHASVTIYVNPKPVANQGPNITIAPSGTGTLLGSASSGTAPYAYSWTTTGGSIIGSPNTPTPTVAAAGTYAILVTDAYGCSSNPASALVNIASSGYTVSGNVAYYLGAVNPQMHNVTVTLIGPSNFTTTTPATGNGNYQFLGIPNGTYTVYLSSSKPWGGVTSADIVAIQNHYKSPPTLLKGIKHIAADVMNPGTTATVIAEDRDLVNSRRLNPAVTFPNTGDWVFTRIDDAANDPASGPFIYANSIGFSNITLVVNNAIVSQDFRALCYGDVDASYTGVKDNENAVINFNTTNGLDLSNFPNPFAGQTTIRFTVPVEGKITVTVQTLLGAPVATINDPDDYEGIHNLTFNRQGLAPGVYLYTVRLKTSDDAFIQTGKMIIVN